MSFPLYDIFSRQAQSLPEQLTQDDLKKLVEDIKQLNQDGIENLYLIVRYSARLENDDCVYSAKYNRKGVVFNLELMPQLLQKIIQLFVGKHLLETQTAVPGVDIVFE
jgi:hypothetical protein